jgi:hypothetical protein
MSGSRLRPCLGPVIALLVVLALGAGTVYAAIPNGSGTYYACLTKSSGVVRLINYPKQKCAKGERFIKWSQQGPAGPAGAQGVQGPEGYPGPKGDPGPAGASGSSNWGDIANKPADLADGQIGWGEVANKPDGFLDGVDDQGVTKIVLTTVESAPSIVADQTVGTAIATCPAGKLVGGGHSVAAVVGGGEGKINFIGSRPLSNATQWRVTAWNGTGNNASFSAFAICMTTDPGTVIATASKGKIAKKRGK